MIVYNIILLSILVLSLMKNKKMYNLIISSILILVSGLRASTIGADTGEYIKYFHYVNRYFKTISIKQFLGFEPGYISLNKIIRTFTNNEQLFLMITSIIMIYLIQKAIYKDSLKIELSYYLFFTFGYFFSSFTIIRQFFAIAILWNSLESIKQRKFFKFMVYVIFAMSFHKTAIIFVILYFIYPLKINSKYLSLIIFFTAINLIFLDKIVLKLINAIPKYSSYSALIVKGEGLKQLCLYSVIFLFVYYFKKKILSKDKIYIHMLALSVVIQGTAYSWSLLTRLTTYFSISIIILIPNILYKFKNKITRGIGVVGVVILGLLYLLLILLQDKGSVVPYRFYF